MTFMGLTALALFPASGALAFANETFRAVASPEFRVQRARLLMAVGRPREAFVALEDLAKAKPDDVAVWTEFADRAWRAGEQAQALAATDKAVSLERDAADLAPSLGAPI
jgi:predicted Zn-dependent protease